MTVYKRLYITQNILHPVQQSLETKSLFQLLHTGNTSQTCLYKSVPHLYNMIRENIIAYVYVTIYALLKNT